MTTTPATQADYAVLDAMLAAIKADDDCRGRGKFEALQILARHRQAHSLPGDVGMRDALEDLLKWADNVCNAHQFGPQKAVVRARAALTPSALSGDAGERE